MTEEEMDEYIGFCAKILVGGGGGDGAVADYFGENGEGGDGQRAEEEQEERTRGAGHRLAAGEEETGLAAGEQYKMWSGVDGAMAEELERVVGRAAEIAGVRAEYLVGVVGTFERRLVMWWKGTEEAEGDDK
ncbi:hypothetical protein CPB84DRAFT_1758076 [Gymnopilus junonius]|uniref:Uncharacterized protein n=1 Tax=Gymnopilus junonius TaxID=109634 RepID=A0A9P5TUV8_GYMJU|nr:hypothetical protein CPB84DRAFT_1758076 [Gymnopilus junonius]